MPLPRPQRAPRLRGVTDVESPASRAAGPDANDVQERRRPTRAHDPITVLIVVPTLDGGAADAGAVELVRILAAAGHRAIVVSRAGRLVADVTAAGGEFIPLDVASNNPDRDAAQRRRSRRGSRANAAAMSSTRSAAPAPGALSLPRALRGIPFVTSWYKGFREQNLFKHSTTASWRAAIA